MTNLPTIPTKPVLAELVTLNVHEVCKVLGVHRTALWKLRKGPDFPRPLGLTRTLAWRAVDIQRWLEQRLAQADDTATQTQQQG